MDVGLGGSLLVLLLPCMLVVALLIKLDSKGPVFFVQKRYGLKGRPFDVLKLRTMYHHLSDPLGARQASANDGRVTHVGRWLRETSLDEVPQLWNVVKGQMSLVGPRPHPIGMITDGKLAPELVPDYFRRYDVKPGMTGWAQVNGCRGPAVTISQLRQRIDHDLAYIDRASFWFDLRILALTVSCLIRSLRCASTADRALVPGAQHEARRDRSPAWGRSGALLPIGIDDDAGHAFPMQLMQGLTQRGHTGLGVRATQPGVSKSRSRLGFVVEFGRRMTASRARIGQSTLGRRP